MPEYVGDCGDVIASLWPVTIAPRIMREATTQTLTVLGATIGVDLNAINAQLDDILDPAFYTAVAHG